MRTDLPRQSIAFASRTPCDALTLVKMAAAASKSSDSTAVSSWLPSDSSLCAPDLLAALLREGRRRLVSSEPTSARQPKTQRARGRIDLLLMASLSTRRVWRSRSRSVDFGTVQASRGAGVIGTAATGATPLHKIQPPATSTRPMIQTNTKTRRRRQQPLLRIRLNAMDPAGWACPPSSTHTPRTHTCARRT